MQITATFVHCLAQLQTEIISLSSPLKIFFGATLKRIRMMIAGFILNAYQLLAMGAFKLGQSLLRLIVLVTNCIMVKFLRTCLYATIAISLRVLIHDTCF
jgi:hypothetical protein